MVAPERPRPARVPARSAGSLTPEQVKKRRTQTLPYRLTPKVIEEYCAAIRSGAPLSMAANFIGVDPRTVERWNAVAAVAERKHFSERSQLERLCIEFRKQVIKAEGEAGLRIHRSIAEAGGVIGGVRTVSMTTKTTHHDNEGKPTGSTVVERVTEVPPDWRAALAVGRYRFPAQMGDVVIVDTETDSGPDVSPGAIWERLQQVRRERSGVVEVDSSEVLEGD